MTWVPRRSRVCLICGCATTWMITVPMWGPRGLTSPTFTVCREGSCSMHFLAGLTEMAVEVRGET